MGLVIGLVIGLFVITAYQQRTRQENEKANKYESKQWEIKRLTDQLYQRQKEETFSAHMKFKSEDACAISINMGISRLYKIHQYKCGLPDYSGASVVDDFDLINSFLTALTFH